MEPQDTIAAITTPPGKGGVGIVRISGPQVTAIMQAMLQQSLTPRHAYHLPFLNNANEIIDIGLALFFKAPHSYTGEDILELQGHGGPVVMDRLLKSVLQHNVRIAHPGEFTERAFLNNKLDLAQAEAVADLIESASEQAAKSAIRSLQGEFSHEIQHLVTQLTRLRMYVEAAIDFPEEEIDFLSDGKIQQQLLIILETFSTIRARAQQGALLRDGLSIVIAGKPNAGKSTLLNGLSGRESAIVTDIPGTTRDVMREFIHLDGLPLHIIDTAGLRETEDVVEREGVRRAWQEIAKADRVLLIIDVREQAATEILLQEFRKQIPQHCPITVVYNKIDLLKQQPHTQQQEPFDKIFLSAQDPVGITQLADYLKRTIGYHANQEGTFIARRRHLDALTQAENFVRTGQQQLALHAAGELLAEDLRQAQHYLGKITGVVTSDDLLGEIFTNFCIGK